MASGQDFKPSVALSVAPELPRKRMAEITADTRPGKVNAGLNV
jgi:hypothetical protein